MERPAASPRPGEPPAPVAVELHPADDLFASDQSAVLAAALLALDHIAGRPTHEWPRLLERVHRLVDLVPGGPGDDLRRQLGGLEVSALEELLRGGSE